MIIAREQDAAILHLPGRALRWIFHPDSGQSDLCSMNVVEISPGETVRPAHSHPNEEEIIYVVSGSGRAYVDGELESLDTGTAILFPRASVHMVQNNGTGPLKLLCFFCPPVSLDDYTYHEEIDFPE